MKPLTEPKPNTGAPAEKRPRLRSAGFWTGSWGVTPGPAARDEEMALMPPREVADCLVQELWQTLRASLEAQARCRLTLPYVALVVTATSGHKEHGTTKAALSLTTL